MYGYCWNIDCNNYNLSESGYNLREKTKIVYCKKCHGILRNTPMELEFTPRDVYEYIVKIYTRKDVSIRQANKIAVKQTWKAYNIMKKTIPDKNVDRVSLALFYNYIENNKEL